MPAAIACPKCQTKYQLPESALGKAVKCKKCGATFKTAARQPTAQPTGVQPRTAQQQPAGQATAQAGAPQASPQELAKLGIDGPLRRPGDIFAGTAPQPGNPLGNFALEDPGFGNYEIAQQEVEAEKADDGMSSIIDNPFATSVNNRNKKKSSKKKRQGQKQKNKLTKQPWFLILAVFIPWFIVGGILGIFFPSLGTGVLVTGFVLLSLINLAVSVWFLIDAVNDSEGVEIVLLLLVPFYVFFFLYNHWPAMKNVTFATLAVSLCLTLGIVALLVAPIIGRLVNLG